MVDFQFPSNVKINGKITVSCMVESGSPPFHFEWLKNGLQLGKSSAHSILTGEEVSSLTFRQVTPQDAGNYTCIVKNTDGSDSHTAPLYIKCKLEQLFASVV